MNSPSSRPTRGWHRKRISALRLSSDSTVTTLPPYTSPPWSKHASLDIFDLDRPPDYPDSAEEADADTDSDEDNIIRRTPLQSPRSQSYSGAGIQSRTHRRPQSSGGNSDPYLDSLLARSVHALEMSNTLLQSSISTQSSLSAVLQHEPIADLSLEARARMLSRRVSSNRDVHATWADDLDEIYRSVEDLVGNSDEAAEEVEDPSPLPIGDMLSKSAPTSSFVDNFRTGSASFGLDEHIRHPQVRRQSSLRRPSLDSMGGSHLEYSNHDRSHFVAPAPRALTIYVDSTDDPDSIVLPPTLGLRATTHLTPLPLCTTRDRRETSVKPFDSTRNLVDVLSSYAGSPPHPGTSSVSSSPRFSFMARSDRSSSASSSSKTVRRVRLSRSPPAKHPTPSPGSSLRSRSLTPSRTTTSPRAPRLMTPPIEELSASSSSSSSKTLRVERTLESLRSILSKQSAQTTSPSSSKSTPLPVPRPSLLSPPTVAPVSGTSSATASISRLFTKARHSSSTRPPSPPRQSALKNRSTPPTPIQTAPSTPTASSLSDTLGTLNLNAVGVPSIRSATSSSGRSTPKRISFAELPESYAGTKPDGAPSRFRDKGKGKERSKGAGKGKGKGKGKDEEDGGWWTGWLLGAAGTGSGAGLSLGAAREERMRGSGWSNRPGYAGSGWEEWGA